MSAHDAWLADYHSSTITVYCANPDCTNAEGITVRYESEYGQGWITPENCPACHADLLDDKPELEEDE
jgi:hypothetical protein